MLKENRKELRREAIEDIIAVLKDYDGYYCDLHNEVFNTDYYIIGTYQAEQQLEKLGTFKVIREVKRYEKEQVGEVFTDLSDPEKLINMYYYIIGEEVIQELELINKIWNDEASRGWNKSIIEELKLL